MIEPRLRELSKSERANGESNLGGIASFVRRSPTRRYNLSSALFLYLPAVPSPPRISLPRDSLIYYRVWGRFGRFSLAAREQNLFVALPVPSPLFGTRLLIIAPLISLDCTPDEFVRYFPLSDYSFIRTVLCYVYFVSRLTCGGTRGAVGILRFKRVLNILKINKLTRFCVH